MQSITRRTVLQRAVALPLTVPFLGGHWAAAAAERPMFRFALIADVQYVDAPTAGSRHYRAALDKLRDCVRALDGEALDFVVNLGDLIDRDFTSFDATLAAMKRLTPPVYHVLGNHDFEVEPAKKSEVPARLGLNERYYTRRVAEGWRLVVLDGTAISTFANAQNSDEYQQAQAMLDAMRQANAPNARPWNGAVDQRQLDWLDQTLTDADRAGETVMVCCHFPIYPDNSHNLLNDRALRALLMRHPSAKVYFNGHNHRGRYASHNGRHFLNLRGMVETADRTAYAIVEAYADRLVVHGFGLEPDRQLALA
jgi:predicted MPP superfamily phosphohydrolase